VRLTEKNAQWIKDLKEKHFKETGLIISMQTILNEIMNEYREDQK
jgi:uncharacterized membrane-anchored protein